MKELFFANGTALIEENEVVMLLLGAGIFVFFLWHRKQIRRIFKWKTLAASYLLLLAGWTFTFLEGFFLTDLLNFMEHFCYACSAFMLALWCLKILRNNLPEKQP